MGGPDAQQFPNSSSQKVGVLLEKEQSIEELKSQLGTVKVHSRHHLSIVTQHVSLTRLQWIRTTAKLVLWKKYLSTLLATLSQENNHHNNWGSPTAKHACNTSELFQLVCTCFCRCLIRSHTSRSRKCSCS
eukprot:GHVT01100870.1.p2 GENE.GHVT01100870.1~~GHVT01100870.1.p2  ORF type:complete len:131 (-),score=5.82 GHVT01100870.1:987-1379(-)